MFYAKKSGKIASALLVMAMLLSFASCGKDAATDGGAGEDIVSETTAGTGENGGEEPTETTDRWARGPSSLPQNDFEGRAFNVITFEVTDPNKMYDLFLTEEQTGDPLNDAVYRRKLNVEEKYNVSLQEIISGTPAETARKSILAGDNSHDLIVDTISNVRNLGGQQLLADLYTMPYVSENLFEAWWDQAAIRDLSINGKLYFQAGDIVLRDKLRLSCIYFNKDMYQSLGLDYPYQYVYDGTWTIDKLVEITKNVNKDLTGDGVMDQYDQWGFMSQYEFALHLFEASGEKMITLNSNGIPEITMNTPRALDVIERALSVCADPTVMFHADNIKGADNIWTKASEYFQEDRFLMRASVFEPIPRDLRAMPTDFGILPTPKFDENQENYYTYAEMSGLVIGIPVNADPEFAGFVTEALAYESGSTIMPAFYDLCLTSKVLRDDESEGMLDIIFNSKVYDIGYIYGISSMPSLLNDLARAGSTDFVSRFEKAQGGIESALAKFMESYE